LLAVLLKLFGPHNLQLAEDVLQDAFSKALQSWATQGVPDNPSAWLVQCSKNRAIDVIRQDKTQRHYAQAYQSQLQSEWTLSHAVSEAFDPSHIGDDQLRMMYLCCQLDLPFEHVLPFLLKALCGLSTLAIARALLLPVETVKKRLSRIKDKVSSMAFSMPNAGEIGEVQSKLNTLCYLMFNEGFHASGKLAVNADLCTDAMALVTLINEHQKLRCKQSASLLTLLHFQFARFAARVDIDGQPIPLDRQNRALWRQDMIQQAMALLHSVEQHPDPGINRYLLEARIASEHCLAGQFDTTNWLNIVQHYGALIALNDSPVARINQAIALAYAGHIQQAIEWVSALQTHRSLQTSHIVPATLAFLHAKAGQKDLANEFVNLAIKRGGTPREQKVLLQHVTELLQQPV